MIFKINKKAISIFMILVLIVTQFNFVTLTNNVNADTMPTSEIQFESDNHYRYYYAQLSDNAKSVYNAIYDMYTSGALKDGKTSWDLIEKGYINESLVTAYVNGNNALIEAVEDARDAFYLDYPDLFYVNMEKFSIRITRGNGSYHLLLGTGNNDSYYIKGFNSVSDVDSAISELNAVVDSLVEGAKQYSTAKEQIEYVHSEVVKATEYKLDYATNYADRCLPTNTGHIRTPYGPLVKHESVCEGYSKAIKVALDKLGIPCILVRGVYNPDGIETAEAHMWNYVKLDEKWYAVDGTFDDPDRVDQYGRDAVLTDYLLAGAGMMSYGHNPDGVMSNPNFEFSYPELEYYYYGSTEVANNDGLKVVYSAPYGSTGDKVSVFDISYKGMNYTEAKKAGYYFLVKYYYSKDLIDGWFYVDYLAANSQLPEGDSSFQMTMSYMEYVEYAVTDIPMDNRAFSSNPTESNKYQRYLPDDEDFIARSGVLECPDANYIAPPRLKSALPYVDSKLKPGVKRHIKLTYDDTLVKVDESKEITCSISTKNAWTSSAEENSKVENIRWNNNNVVEFDFTPSTQYGDNSVVYFINIENLVGNKSGKPPVAPYYYVQETYGCTSSMAQAKAWRVYARPTLIDSGDVDFTGWTLDDGEVTAENADVLNQLTDRMALMVSPVSSTQEEEMNSAINNANSNVLKTELYNINLVVCNKKVLSTANGHKMTVYLGFPEGYGPESEGVSFKVYHFNKNTNAMEQIDCVVTPYGLLVTCDSFSPYAVAVVEATEEELADTTKSVIFTTGNNGTIVNAEEKIVKLAEGESIDCVVKAETGYVIDSLVVCGEEVAEAKGNETYNLSVSYASVSNENNGVTATFVASSVVEEEVARNEETVTPEVTEAVINDLPAKINVVAGQNVEITPTIEASNGVDTYQWYKDGEVLAGRTNNILSLENITEEDYGTYTLVVTSTIDSLSKTVESTPCVIGEEEPEETTTVKIQYIDENNVVIKEQEELTGVVGTTTTYTVPEIEGYEIVGATSINVLFSTGDITITINYRKIVVNSTVTIKHVDENGALLKEEILTGEVGTTTTYTVPEIEGYEIVGDTTINVQFTAENTEQTVNYKKNEETVTTTVTIKHVDENGTLLKEETLTGKVGTTTTYTVPEIEGYEIVGATIVNVSFTEENTELTINYTEVVEIVTTTVTITLLDENGEVIKQETLTGEVGTTITYTIPQMDGYELKGESQITITFGGSNVISNVAYKKVVAQEDPEEPGEDEEPTENPTEEPTEEVPDTTVEEPVTNGVATGDVNVIYYVTMLVICASVIYSLKRRMFN